MSSSSARSLPQRVATTLLPWWAEDMERETREWRATCPECGHSRDLWELGAVRFKARSRGKRTGMTCPACGKFGMHGIERHAAEEAG
jgi:ssDNA-binding Zn-finger/Zn-ribbon topoisomerase 1